MTLRPACWTKWRTRPPRQWYRHCSEPMTDKPTVPPITYRGVVYPWQCDHMGHLNVMWVHAHVRRGHVESFCPDRHYSHLHSRTPARDGSRTAEHRVQEGT